MTRDALDTYAWNHDPSVIVTVQAVGDDGGVFVTWPNGAAQGMGADLFQRCFTPVEAPRPHYVGTGEYRGLTLSDVRKRMEEQS